MVGPALSAIGSPYSWGAAGPSAFDCSGLVVWAYRQVGVSLPHSSYALAGVGSWVPRDDMAPGDIVIYYGGSHAAIYTGDGMVVHASTYGQPVRQVSEVAGLAEVVNTVPFGPITISSAKYAGTTGLPDRSAAAAVPAVSVPTMATASSPGRA